MKKVLLTGMSGVGKSTVLNALQKEGYLTVDLDLDNWIYFDEIEDDYIMNIEKIIQFLASNTKKSIFLAGTTVNQGKLYPYLDFIITLTAPLEVMRTRILERTDNPFGKSKDEWNKIVEDKYKFEKLLINGSDATIDTNNPLEDVVNEVYQVIGILSE